MRLGNNIGEGSPQINGTEQEPYADDSSSTSHESVGTAASEIEALVDDPGVKFAVKTWSEIAKRTAFEDTKAEIYTRFKEDKKFRGRVQRSARSYIETKLSPEVRRLWEKVRGDNKQAPQGERKVLADLIVGFGQYYLLDTSALLLYLGETDFDTCFYKNPIGSALVGLLADMDTPLQIRERDFNTLGEVAGSCGETPPRLLGPRHYLVLSKCMTVLDELKNRADPQADDKHIDRTYDLYFDNLSVVIPISVRSLSFQAQSYNSPGGIEALARHITEKVSRVCFVLVDEPHVSSDLQADLIRELSGYVDLPLAEKNAASLTQILSKYFELDEDTKQPKYAHGLPVIKTTGDKYQSMLRSNRQHGVEWQEKYLPKLAVTFEKQHFKDFTREQIFERDYARELGAISPPPRPIEQYKSYYYHMLSLLSTPDILQQADEFVDSSILSKPMREPQVAFTPRYDAIFSYLVVVCDFIIQAGLYARAGALAGYDKYTKSEMVDVFVRTYNMYTQYRDKVTMPHGLEEKSSTSSNKLAVPYVTPIERIAYLITDGGRPDVDAYINAVCSNGQIDSTDSTASNQSASM